MSLVKLYQTFRAHLGGYTEVDFDAFRKQVVPLRQKRAAWAEEECEYIRDLIAAGAAYALQRFFGSKHRAASEVLGMTPLRPDPMTKPELLEYLSFVIEKCRTDGWASGHYDVYARYLDSDTMPAQLATATPEMPEHDHFAALYRGASAAFRQCVREQYAAAGAAEARRSNQNEGL